jgi:hypothetical protein
MIVLGFDPGIALLCLGLPALAACSVMFAYDLPRGRELALNAKLRAAVKRAVVEATGLRKSLEGAELRMRDVRAATAGIDENLRFKIQRMPARDQAALDALIGQGTFSGLLALLRNGAMVDRRLASLERVWSRGSSERESVRALCENLWVLEPDLKTEGHIFAGKSLGAVAEAYFGAPQPSDDLSAMAARKKPSAVGMFRRRTAIARPNDQGERTLVIIEARRPGDTLNQAVVTAAVGYAHAMRKLVPELGDWPVECYVIGGAFTEDAEFAASHAPPGTPVVLTTWEGLLNRARSRRPETVSLNEIRFDGDQPPVFDLTVRSRALGSFLDAGDGDGEDETGRPESVHARDITA